MAQLHTDVHHLASAPVVVGVDGPAADTALDWAVDLALRRDRELRIVHGLDLEGVHRRYGEHDPRVPMMLETLSARGTAVVQRAVRRVREARPGLRVSTELSESGPAGLLVGHSARAYRLILGHRSGHGLVGHLGSTVVTVAGHGQGAVVVVRPDSDDGHWVRTQGPVIVGIDGGPVSEAAVGATFEEASERGAELIAVHVWSDLDVGRFVGVFGKLGPVTDIGELEREILAERLAGWQEKYPEVTVDRRLYPTDPAATLQHWSESAQLVVVGSRGRGGFLGMLLGSTSNSLVQHARCPVMVVHPAEP
ncbi:nucleotide-binding universal stress UspA family protein [Nocardia pseudobrasiliensis]|uniref:Nucleotide-binding universal stress UspA family protein n=2 Tax=Nocardia pseudobrasiliensis TaxID=45979 RepID=A0A370HPH3_9NOCA|nr:nucleotide-binding universal stress UspA family protein [Nocardia pseudobrasiliensis]